MYRLIEHNLRSVDCLIKYPGVCHPYCLLWWSQHIKCRIRPCPQSPAIQNFKIYQNFYRSNYLLYFLFFSKSNFYLMSHLGFRRLSMCKAKCEASRCMLTHIRKCSYTSTYLPNTKSSLRVYVVPIVYDERALIIIVVGTYTCRTAFTTN